jgi:hypothetical protein
MNFGLMGTLGAGFLVPLLLSFCAGCEVVDNESANPNTPRSSTPRGSLTEMDVTVVLGEDYSLPEWAEPEPFSGYIGDHQLSRPEGSTPIQSWHVSWRDLEPERGQYNWAEVESRLAMAEAQGYKLNILLTSITHGGGNDDLGIGIESKVPDWVIEDFGLTEEHIIDLGWEFDQLIIPGWRYGIRTAFNDLVRAFGEQGFPQSPQLATCYILGISPSRGEEFWLTQEALDILESDHGFSVNVLDDWMTSRFEAFEEAFAGVTHKLAWVGKVESWRWVGEGRYLPLAQQLVEDAWAMGAGTRSSAIEKYNEWLIEGSMGQDVDEEGYLTVDESLPQFGSARYFGDENEEYGEEWVWRFGSMAGEAQRYRFSILRSLQMRMRFLWTSEAAESINPPLSRYCAMSLGKSVENSPDAWAYLRQTPVRAYFHSSGFVKNFERFLMQRDLPGGMTIPAQRTHREFDAGSNHNSSPDMWYDDIARRTDVASGNPYIYFDLDDRFEVEGSVIIKLEILDDSHAAWHLEYHDPNLGLVLTPEFANRADGQVKTVSFAIPEPFFDNGLDHGMDFRLNCSGPENVSVRWVRVVNLDQD